MGSGQSNFNEDELKEYQELTYFTQKEILHCYKRFHALAPEIIDKDRNAKLSKDLILSLPELLVNPFRTRICKVFSSANDGDMTFEDFLDMMSVFSEHAPKSVKVEYAFRIYDFNEDDFICGQDLRRVVGFLCGRQKLSNESLNRIVDKIMKEADLDEDNQLSFAEFEHVIEKAPDFASSFRIRI